MNKTRKFLFGILLILFVMLFLGCSAASHEDNKVEWTFLFYNDADSRSIWDPMSVFIENMFSGDNVNVLVLRDVHARNWRQCNNIVGKPDGDSTAGIYLVDQQNKVRLLKDLGEVSMGASKTLSDFIMYAKTLYPAKRYFLSFFNRGLGIHGTCWDDTNHDWLKMNEMKEGLKNSGGVDIIMFGVPCFMGEIGAVYELRQYTDVYIGSEGEGGSVVWNQSIADIRDILMNHPHIDTYDLGREILKSIEKNLVPVESTLQLSTGMTTMSAIRSDKINGLVSQLDEIFVHYMNHQEKFNRFMDTHYWEIETYFHRNMDLGSFLKKLSEFESDPHIGRKLFLLQDRLKEAVLGEIHGSDFPDSHGVAIYHPDKKNRSLEAAVYQWVDFGRDTHWDELLINYFGPDKIIESTSLYRDVFTTEGYLPGGVK